ncbi:hypothetical protein GCM10010297_12850 [Streptomyces malachitofuscus]|nr:hypothetical protein GCM10010297_12850 [Streptomyces malachitofuscus]
MPGAIAYLMADLSAICKLLQVLCNKFSDDVPQTGSAHMAAPGGRGLDSSGAVPGPEVRSSDPCPAVMDQRRSPPPFAPWPTERRNGPASCVHRAPVGGPATPVLGPAPDR